MDEELFFLFCKMTTLPVSFTNTTHPSSTCPPHTPVLTEQSYSPEHGHHRTLRVSKLCDRSGRERHPCSGEGEASCGAWRATCSACWCADERRWSTSATTTCASATRRWMKDVPLSCTVTGANITLGVIPRFDGCHMYSLTLSPCERYLAAVWGTRTKTHVSIFDTETHECLCQLFLQLILFVPQHSRRAVSGSHASTRSRGVLKFIT